MAALEIASVRITANRVMRSFLTVGCFAFSSEMSMSFLEFLQ